MSSIDTATPAQNRALAEDVYNMIMAEIEPDLLLENIPLLEKTYENETPEEHTLRMQRYAESYKKFDQDLALFMNDVDGKVRETKRRSLKAKEEQARSEDADKLESIASAFG